MLPIRRKESTNQSIKLKFFVIVYSCDIAESYLLDDIGNYKYLTHGNVPLPNADDPEQYKLLRNAMNIMGITKDEQDCEWRHFFHACYLIAGEEIWQVMRSRVW